VTLVVEGVPVGDLPAGARLRVGDAAMIELGSLIRVASPLPAVVGAIVETGDPRGRWAEVLEGGLVAPGDPVVLEAVAVQVTDVLDLHSFRPEDVPAVVAEYLVEARRAGLVDVRIVHGRGRGVQRAVVRRLLADAPGVAAFAEAAPARGGWGATLVRLKRLGDAPLP
jgi:hypothetical protein